MAKGYTVNVRPEEEFSMDDALHGMRNTAFPGDPNRVGLIEVMKRIPAKHRRAAFEAAIQEIEEKERRATLERALREKVETLSCDELERLIKAADSVA
jgi:hypothetical protein